MKLIKLTESHYIIVDNSEIKEGDWVLETLNNVIFQVKVSGNDYKNSTFKKITHSTQPLDERGYWGKVMPLTLTIFEIKELIGEVDVEKKAEEQFKKDTEKIPVPTSHWIESKNIQFYSYVKGYNQALEDNKDKKYTEEDMKVAITQAFLSGVERLEDFDRVQEMILDNVKPKTEWEVEIVEGKLKLK